MAASADAATSGSQYNRYAASPSKGGAIPHLTNGRPSQFRREEDGKECAGPWVKHASLFISFGHFIPRLLLEEGGNGQSSWVGQRGQRHLHHLCGKSHLLWGACPGGASKRFAQTSWCGLLVIQPPGFEPSPCPCPRVPAPGCVGLGGGAFRVQPGQPGDNMA